MRTILIAWLLVIPAAIVPAASGQGIPHDTSYSAPRHYPSHTKSETKSAKDAKKSENKLSFGPKKSEVKSSSTSKKSQAKSSTGSKKSGAKSTTLEFGDPRKNAPKSSLPPTTIAEQDARLRALNDQLARQAAAATKQQRIVTGGRRMDSTNHRNFGGADQYTPKPHAFSREYVRQAEKAGLPAYAIVESEQKAAKRPSHNVRHETYSINPKTGKLHTTVREDVKRHPKWGPHTHTDMRPRTQADWELLRKKGLVAPLTNEQLKAKQRGGLSLPK